MKTTRTIWLWLALLVACSGAFANTGRQGRDVPLAELSGDPQPLRLNGAAGQQTLALPLGARETVKSATLHLVATNSTALLGERSQLVVQLNDRVIAQLPLSPKQPEIVADIRLPLAQLKPGYNRLTFAAAQHYTLQCEDPSAPELWSEIDVQQSTLRIDTELQAQAPTLDRLDAVFDPAQWHDRRLTVVTAAQPGANELGWGAQLTQGSALRLRYQPLAVQHRAVAAGHGEGPVPGLDPAVLGNGDAMLVGTLAQLKPYLDPALAAKVKSGFLGVYPLPGDARRVLLIATGRDAAEVGKAVAAFAGQHLPRQAELAVTGLALPKLAPYAGLLAAPGSYTLRELGFRTRNVKGMSPEAIETTLRLPPDLYSPENSTVGIALNYAVGAKLRADSVLNVLVNGQFVQVIPLDQDKGGLVERYKLEIPLRAFRPGDNTIAFQPRMTPLVTGSCQLYQTENLQLTVFDDSTLTLPKVSHFARLPDLNRLAATAFPYAVQADGADLGVQVTERSSDSIAAAWTLLGKLAQKHGLPLSAAAIGFDAPPADRHLLVVGSRPPAALLEGAPWQPGRPMQFTQPVVDTAQGAGWWSRQWVRLSGGRTAEAATIANTEVRADATLAGQLLAMQYRSPLDGDRTVTVFVAGSPADLARGSAELIEPANWDRLGDDVSLLRIGETGIVSQRVGAQYDAGSIGVTGRIGYAFSQHPLVWLALTLTLVGLLALVTVKLLRRFYLRHHTGVEEEQ
ncbi:cellulose biosynthesis cyclic di-GMP-binding regulatory protein BcsB [Jeongeupia naejangsanensis]|uniref:Cyclic di-GMP-binding protein n=1 Tax=Jeongeupia naejangsanensis TaxID=613195 RepID=A0ABS2BLR5_9NEIS|nr:cellulose biosynthesis cyclic di-GMP-binding regulatory protein BcsB [Jeongeupia naejangsanensis]MBM3116380.1 cellulose biosynthesis cyclic di-GMP-binding regulatory protein BcsB [Jeongeupia naejangsanensis]